jgi:polyisoprenoid-binding protein YceI
MTAVTRGALLAGDWRVITERTRATFTVRKLGLITVHGSIVVLEGSATLDASGRPTAASVVLEPTTIATGNTRRDADLRGPRFFDVARFDTLRFRAEDVEPADDGWLVRGHLTVRDRQAPLDLTVSHQVDAATGTATVRAHGVLDRATTGLRAPRWLIGRWIGVEVTAVLVRAASG